MKNEKNMGEGTYHGGGIEGGGRRGEGKEKVGGGVGLYGGWTAAKR